MFYNHFSLYIAFSCGCSNMVQSVNSLINAIFVLAKKLFYIKNQHKTSQHHVTLLELLPAVAQKKHLSQDGGAVRGTERSVVFNDIITAFKHQFHT